MEQMYLIEIFIDKISVIINENVPDESDPNKSLIVKMQFGPKIQLILKEGQMAKVPRQDDMVACDSNGNRKWTRTLRIGQSYLFPSYPDHLLALLSQTPLDLELWSDDLNEVQELIGVGRMKWDSRFFAMLKEATDAGRLHDPLTIKQIVPMYNECCCGMLGDIQVILRVSALGDSVITEFQQLVDVDPQAFVFRTNKAPSMIHCKQVEGENPNFCMVGVLYEGTTLEDPDLIGSADQHMQVCVEQASCAVKDGEICKHEASGETKYHIENIRMGDIAGPCGNSNCPLAHRIKQYIRNLDAYKEQTKGKIIGTKGEGNEKKACGRCVCPDDTWHRDTCPERTDPKTEKETNKTPCVDCENTALGDNCPEKTNPQVNYMTDINHDPELMKSIYGGVFIVNNCQLNENKHQCNQSNGGNVNMPSVSKAQKVCGCGTSNKRNNFNSDKSFTVYNAEIKTKCDENKPPNAVFCTDFPEDKECRCRANKPTPPCKTFDCECLTRAAELDARKHHKPFCPAYKHKPSCPVTMRHEGEEEVNEFEDELVEPLPYGLDPLALGPCPVLGRPCTVPDGFARMYKTAMMPTQPPSYSDAGKVCCSKEYERIKKALKDYMVTHKGDDFRCVNRFNIDTERRCCDKEQRLLDLVGKSCCGSHSMAKNEEKKP